MGWSLDALFEARDVRLADHVMADAIVPGWIKALGAVLFLVMALGSAWRLQAADRLAAGLDWLLPVRVTRRRLAAVAVLAMLVMYGSTSVGIVQPGELGMRKVFGRVVATDLKPGLHLAPPVPFGRIEIIQASRIRRLDLSFAIGGNGAEDGDPVQRWVLLGDENIASIQCAAHWRMQAGASRAFAYGVADRERTVSRAVQAALRTTLSAATIETVFTTAQGSLASAVRAEGQAILDACGCGIELVAFQFLDLHAPAEVHDAFRDIASALEDQETRRNRALRDMARVEPIARARGTQILRAAEGTAATIVAQAQGAAGSFLDEAAAHAAFPRLNRLRLIMEMYDRVLPGKRKCIKPSHGNMYIDLRYGQKTDETEPAF
jgi:membrane protease subunit HflK